MSILSLGHGFHRGVAPSVYHERVQGMVSKTALDLVHRSPLHLKAWLDGAEEESTPALVLGSGFHCALLEPERFASEYVVQPDFGDCRTKANKAKRDEWRADHDRAEWISAEDNKTIVSMVASVHSHPLAGKMIRDGISELTVRWQDKETGLEGKARADYYVEKHGMILDAKSAIDASAATFARSAANLRYHVQAALYTDAFATVGAPVEHFLFIAVEKTAPFAVAIYTLDAEAIGRGHSRMRGDIDTLAECVRTNTWPGYPASIQTLTLPAWAA